MQIETRRPVRGAVKLEKKKLQVLFVRIKFIGSYLIIYYLHFIRLCCVNIRFTTMVKYEYANYVLIFNGRRVKYLLVHGCWSVTEINLNFGYLPL